MLVKNEKEVYMKKLWILKKSLLGILMIVPILVLISTGVAHADRWAIAYGTAQSDQAYSVQQTSDGGFIVAGVTNTSGYSAAWVLKLDANGGIEWQKTYGGTDTNYVVKSIQQTSDGRYILAGETDANGSYDVWVLKLKSNGIVNWQNTYGAIDKDERAYSIQQTSDNGYIIAAEISPIGEDSGDFWVLKLNVNGNVGPGFAGTWQKSYDISQNDVPHSIKQTSDGGFILAGEAGTTFPSVTSDALVMKLNPNGTENWIKTYGDSNVDLANSVQQISGGGYIVAGETSSFGAGGSDLWVLKLNTDGTVNWEKAYGGSSGDESGYSVQETSDGKYIVAGETSSFGAGGGDVWVLLLNADGTVNWEITYGGTSADSGYSVQQTADGGYIVAGATSSFGEGNSDFWVLRIDKNGEIPDCGEMDTSIATVTPTGATTDEPTVMGKLNTTVSNKKSFASATNTTVTGDEVCSHQEPDLIISSFSTPFSVSAGVAFDVKDTTKNIGSAGTGITTTTRFYLSADNILDGADTSIGSRSVSALGAGASDTDTTPVTIPPSTPAGNYYIIAKADDSDGVIESVENNNTKVNAITVMKVKLLMPNGGEVIPSGRNWAICWDAPSTAVKFVLKFSKNNGTKWNLIKKVVGLHCTGWEVPIVAKTKDQCLVKVIGYDKYGVIVGSDKSDNTFTIEK
jgi:uncharacterized delta-60 repeat protein